MPGRCAGIGCYLLQVPGEICWGGEGAWTCACLQQDHCKFPGHWYSGSHRGQSVCGSWTPVLEMELISRPSQQDGCVGLCPTAIEVKVGAVLDTRSTTETSTLLRQRQQPSMLAGSLLYSWCKAESEYSCAVARCCFPLLYTYINLTTRLKQITVSVHYVRYRPIVCLLATCMGGLLASSLVCESECSHSHYHDCSQPWGVMSW